MKRILAPLSPNEESALLRIGFGTEGALDAKHIRRLLQLELIEWGDQGWRLTSIGRRRYECLVTDMAQPSAA